MIRDIEQAERSMLILRCTRKLRIKNLGPIGHEDFLSPTLGTWHANLIYVARSPLVICVNDRSLLSVIVPGRQFPNILSTITARIVERLKRMGLSEELLLQEQAAMKVVKVESSNSKSVLGSMNDFVRLLKWDGGDRLNLAALDDLEDALSETPMGALKYHYPVEIACEVLGIPEEEFRRRRSPTRSWGVFPDQ